MAALSTAVDPQRVSAIVGYEIKGSLEGLKAGNLPQRVGILAEANTANQSGLPTSINFTSAKEVGEICGYGSPAYLIARILRPISGDKLGGIPTVIYPVAEAGAGVAKVLTIGITGTATKTVTHKIVLAGRDQLDGQVYSFVVEKDDTAAEISQKIIDAVNGVLGAPAIGTVVTDDAVLTAKWVGITSNELNVSIDQQGESAGLTYAVTDTTPGAGVPDVSTALGNLGEEWTTIIVNGIGADSTILDALEAYIGNVNTGTGKYLATDFRPAIALFGDNTADTLAEVTALVDSRKNEMANAFCPAPNSKAFSFEAPANYAFVYAPLVQANPQTDPIGSRLLDMPAPEDIGDFADVSKRDQIVKIGGSTVKLNSGDFEIVDFVTTYHPTNEPPTATLFRWVRDMIGIDFNIKYGYTLLEEIYVVGKTIIPSTSSASAKGTISPDRWAGIIKRYAGELEDRALIADASFMSASIQVQIGESNANRLETTFKAQRTGTARVLSTTAEALFKFGN
jgi:phage tail sheath gpL-like